MGKVDKSRAEAARHAREYEDEVAILVQVLKHRAGYNVALYGDLLVIRTTEGHVTVEVEWQTAKAHDPDGKFIERVTHFVHARSFKGPTRFDQAVRFFIKKRKRLKLGEDFPG